jgi:hypothetical protein
MAELKAVVIIHADIPAAPSDEQWIELFREARLQPLATAIRQAVHATTPQGQISTHKRSQAAAFLRDFTCVTFEIDERDRDMLLVVLDEQATLRGISGNTRTQFEGVLEAELQDAATVLGYGPAVVAQLKVESDTEGGNGLVGLGTHDEAAAEWLLYRTANADIWDGGA